MSSENTDIEKAREEMEDARFEVMQTEKEIQTIKTALRDAAAAAGSGLQGDPDGSGVEPNSLKISALKVLGLPDAAKPKFKVQLSSPVEELSISKLYDPLDEDAEGSVAKFTGVEISVATLVVSASDEDIPLGSSAPHDVAPLCEFDAMSPRKKLTELDVAILPGGGGSLDEPSPVEKKDEEKEKQEEKVAVDPERESFEDAISEEGEAEEKGEKKAAEVESKLDEAAPVTNEEESSEGAKKSDEVEEKVEGEKLEGTTEEATSTKDEDGSPSEKAEESKAESKPVLETPICTVTLRIEFIPSAKDQRDELYDLLNKASKRKALAIDKLRRSAATVSRARPSQTESSAESESTSSDRAVKSGFLNKKSKKKKEPSIFVRLYERTIGPESLVRKIFPIAKNYCIFFGVVAFFHFKGQEFALPAPV